MQRLRNSWELGKVSWGVLRSDKTLVLFPILSGIATLVVVGVLGGLVALTGVDDRGDTEGLKAIGYVYVGIAYIAVAFITSYFLGALVHAANERLSGRDTRLGESLNAATSKTHRLLPWALVQATVSVVLNALEEQGWFGQILASLLGTAWSVLTFLTVPVIMLEDVGPITGLKRSGNLLKKTWGENISGQFGFSLLGFVLILPAIVVIALAVSSGSAALAIVLGVPVALWVIAVFVAISAMSGIYRTALYRFTVDGQAPPEFQGVDLGDAFAPRERRGGLFG